MQIKWYLVRHGETDWNLEGRAQGHSDTPLNDKGRIQAERAGARLAPTPFVAAYGSDLTRVADTAAAIIRGRRLALKPMSALREKFYGEWEGITYEDAEARYPGMYQQLFQDNTGFAPPGGENDFDLYKRVMVAAEQIRDTLPDAGGNILVVGHGGALRALLVCLLRIPVEYMWRFRLSNGGISIITDFQDGSATLDLLNDTGHLEDGL